METNLVISRKDGITHLVLEASCHIILAIWKIDMSFKVVFFTASVVNKKR